MMKIKKKGLSSMSVLAGLALVIIMGIVLFPFTTKTTRDQEETLGKTLCKNSIMTSSSEKSPDFSRESCKPDRIIIKKEQFEEDADIDNLVKKEIADLMIDCWNMVGNGKLEPYSKKLIDYVFICSIVSFEEIDNFNGLNLWLLTHNMPIKDESYFKYLYGVPTQEQINQHEQASDFYDTSKEYAIIWKMSVDFGVSEIQWNDILFLSYPSIIPLPEDMRTVYVPNLGLVLVPVIVIN